jgi:SWIM zinc finger
MGVVPECYKKLKNRWTTCASYKVFEIEESGNKYKVTRPMNNCYPTNHVIQVNECFCSCGMWQAYEYPCVDAMAYFRFHEKKTLLEVMSSHYVSNFYKYSHYHELMKHNITPVVWDNLVKKKEWNCLPPDVVTKKAGRPVTKRLRVRSKFGKPEDSNIVCSICGERGHNKRTCITRQNI